MSHTASNLTDSPAPGPLTTTAEGDAPAWRWRSEAGLPIPAEVIAIDDSCSADVAYRHLAAGTALLWQGDWVNGRHLLTALIRRADRRLPHNQGKTPRTPAERFVQHRTQQGARATLLARLWVPLDADYRIPLRRAQDVAAACTAAWGAPDKQPSRVALRELLAVISAYEWRKKGVFVPALGETITPHYGVFSPIRGEYLDLLAQAPLPADHSLAVDIGTGTGVIAALLARRGIARVIATDNAPRALACARENIEKLGLTVQVCVQEADLFPPGRAPLIVCNPPWLPAQPTSPIESAVFDPDSRMLRAFLRGLPAHLTPEGEGWLILSDLAEHLGLRSPGDLQNWISSAGLRVVEQLTCRPRHPKTRDNHDPLHAARAREITSLWRLALA